MAFRQIGSMCCNLIGHDTRAHILLVGQGQVLLGRHVAEHGRTEPGYLCTADGRGDVVVARCDVGDERTEGVERSLVAVVELPLHVLLYFLQRHVSGTFDESLYVFVPGTGDKFAHGVEFGKLGLVVGVGDTAGTQTVSKGKGNVVLRHDVADVIEMLVEETLPVVYQAPLAHDAAATAHDAAETLVGQVDIVAADAGVDGEVVYTLLTLFDECVLVDFPAQVFHLAVHLFQSLVDGYGANGHRTVAHDPLAGFVDVVARGEVHQSVASPFARPYRLVHLLFYAGGSGRVADVGIDFYKEVAANDHRFAFGVVDVGRESSTAPGYLVAHKFGGDMALDAQFLAVHVLTDSHIFHFGRDDARLGVCHLGDVLAGFGAAREPDVLEAQLVETMVGEAHLAILACYLRQLLRVAPVDDPLFAQAWQSFLQVHLVVGVTVRSARVVDIYRSIGLGVRYAAVVLHYSRREVDFCHTDRNRREEFPLHVRFFSLGVGFVVVWHGFREN